MLQCKLRDELAFVQACDFCLYGICARASLILDDNISGEERGLFFCLSFPFTYKRCGCEYNRHLSEPL